MSPLLPFQRTVRDPSVQSNNTPELVQCTTLVNRTFYVFLGAMETEKYRQKLLFPVRCRPLVITRSRQNLFRNPLETLFNCWSSEVGVETLRRRQGHGHRVNIVIE